MKWIQVVASLTLASLAGCGSEADKFTLVPVSGTVTMNGKPLAEATVSFIPDQGNKESTAGADTTGPEGTYKAGFQHRSGLAPGKYKVIITPPLPASAKVNEAFAKDPYMAKLSLGGQEKKVAGAKNEFDIDVTEKGGTFDFDVKSSSAAATK
jgi:hypothetical protein